MPGFKEQTSKEAETKSNSKEKQILAREEFIEKMTDPEYLPAVGEVDMAFGDLSFAETYNAWKKLCDERKIYELVTEEYINKLADYIIARTQEYQTNKDRPTIILELGAGNGRLSHFLGKKLEEKSPKSAKVIATDSGEWKIKPDFQVERLEIIQALKKYNPDIVIFSWMPNNTDFTKEIRECQSVKEYILIGRANEGVCGKAWETWGTLEKLGQKTPPYEADGFEREDLSDFTQFGRADEPHRRLSETVSFKRITKK